MAPIGHYGGEDDDRVSVGTARSRVLYDFVNNEALPGTDIKPDSFWRRGQGRHRSQPTESGLLRRRDELQARLKVAPARRHRADRSGGYRGSSPKSEYAARSR